MGSGGESSLLGTLKVSVDLSVVFFLLWRLGQEWPQVTDQCDSDVGCQGKFSSLSCPLAPGGAPETPMSLGGPGLRK